MMKKMIKGFIIRVINTTLLVIASIGDNITDVYFNTVNLKVNGKTILTDNILLNGTSFVHLRAV